MTSNHALADELEAVNSIYEQDTSVINSNDVSSTKIVLKLPDLPFSFTLSFPAAYPDTCPSVDGIQSTGLEAKKGEGIAALETLREVLGRIYVPGQVCLFDLVEEVTPVLQARTARAQHDPDHADSSQNESEVDTDAPIEKPPSQLSNLHVKDAATDSMAAIQMTPPNWTLSEALVVNKSTFVARALTVITLSEARSSISHLVTTNKKVAAATHNITAWRIKSRPSPDAPEITIQDCDDDGETAAGGRLLHLMQLMDVWNVVVVVSRWYGGVKLGPDRFRCINMVARESLVKGGFVTEEGDHQTPSKGKNKKK